VRVPSLECLNNLGCAPVLLIRSHKRIVAYAGNVIETFFGDLQRDFEPSKRGRIGPAQIVAGPMFKVWRLDLRARFRVAAHAFVGAGRHKLAGFGSSSSTRRIMGVIGTECGFPFLVLSPGSSIELTRTSERRG
jgi:hypothetical protein